MADRHPQGIPDSLLVELVKEHVAAVQSTNQIMVGMKTALDALNSNLESRNKSIDTIHDFVKTETTQRETSRGWVLRVCVPIFIIEGIIIAALIHALGQPAGAVMKTVFGEILSIL